MKFGLTLICTIAVIGCSQSPLSETQATCQSTDWYEKGRQDGSTGVQPRIEKYQSSCGDAFHTEDKALYMNGFHAGQTDYCSHENGFQVAQMGGPLENHCPELMKEAFKQGYIKGIESRKLKAKNQELARKIQTLSRQAASRSISSVEKGSISSELEHLKRQYAQNQKKISRMNN